MEHLQQVQQLVQSYAAELQALRTQVASLQAETMSLRAQLDSRPSRLMPSLLDPDKFTGALLTWDTWLPLIKAKLQVDSKAIGGSKA